MQLKNFFKELFQTQDKVYQLAVRKIDKDGRLFFDREDYCFHIIGNESKLYWKADPFLFEYEGETYVFYELYQYYIRRGVIAYSKLIDNDRELKLTKPKVIIKENTHFSFPNVFRSGEDIFMIPETCEKNEVCLYKCVSFPDEWKKTETIITDIYTCDTLYLEDVELGGRYILTSQMDKIPVEDRVPSCYVYNKMFRLNTSDWTITDKKGWDLQKGECGVRNGGLIRYKKADKSMTIRVGQNCKNGKYGRDFILYEILKIFPYREKQITHVSLEMLENHVRPKVELTGAHTYNATNKYEIIDISMYQKLPFYVRAASVLHHCYSYLKNRM